LTRGLLSGNIPAMPVPRLSRKLGVAAVAALCFFSSPRAEAQSGETSGGLFWSKSGNAITITGTDLFGEGYNFDPNVVIPSKINGTPVTTIGDQAFYLAYLTSIKIPSTVTLFKTPKDFTYTPNLLGAGIQNVEQYYAQEYFSGTGLANVLPSAVNNDISPLEDICTRDWTKFDPHGWPIRFYTATVQTTDFYYHLGYDDAFNILGTKGAPPYL